MTQAQRGWSPPSDVFGKRASARRRRNVSCRGPTHEAPTILVGAARTADRRLARKVDPAVLAFLLLAGEAGLRRGEIAGLPPPRRAMARIDSQPGNKPLGSLSGEQTEFDAGTSASVKPTIRRRARCRASVR